jgi:uncharacterized delta-60 repeat protein
MQKLLILLSFLCTSHVISAQVSGTLDLTFGTNGRVTTPVSQGSDFANVIVVQADNKILVAGRYQQKPLPGTIFIDSVYSELVRYNPNGTIDNTFGTNGKATLPNNISDSNDAWAMTVQNDGKILVAGYGGLGGFFIARFTTNGALDLTFNGNGIVKKFFRSSQNLSPDSDVIYSILVQNDGKIIVAGRTIEFSAVNSLIGLARFNADGSFDVSFGNQGRVIKQVNANKSIDIRSISLQSNNKILIAGYQFVNVFGNVTQRDMVILRYNSIGIIDSSFANNGVLVTPNCDAFSIKVLSNDKIVVGGSVDIDTIQKTKAFALFQYTTNGILDNTFGTNGKVVSEIRNNCFATDMIVQKDNKILLAGAGPNTVNNSDFIMARYNVNGSFDNSFGTNGQSVIIAADYWLEYFRMALQNDGKIVVSHTYNSANKYNFVVSRYNNNIAGVGTDNASIEKKGPLSIFPNPTKNDLNIDLKDKINTDFSIKISDLTGRIVYQNKYDKTLINNVLQINIGDLTSGLYVVTIQSEKEIMSQLISKN